MFLQPAQIVINDTFGTADSDASKVQEGAPEAGNGLPKSAASELRLGPDYSAQAVEVQKYTAEQVAAMETDLQNRNARITEIQVVLDQLSAFTSCS